MTQTVLILTISELLVHLVRQLKKTPDDEKIRDLMFEVANLKPEDSCVISPELRQTLGLENNPLSRKELKYLG